MTQTDGGRTVQDSARGAEWLGLAGKVCVVTGAASGIGTAIATGLAETGAHVVLLDLNAAAAETVATGIRNRGGRALAIGCDTSNQGAVRAAADRSASEMGGCDVLVNNAGILRPGGLDTLSLELWNQIIAVNLTGYFLCAQAFGKQMMAKGKGAMAHVASIAGHNPQPFSGAYSVTKAGVIMLSRQIALEWGPMGIRSNAVCPGTIRTPLSEEFYKVPGVVEAREKATPIGRIGYPKDIADAVILLVSERAGFITGDDILVDGGLEKSLMAMIPRPGHEAPGKR